MNFALRGLLEQSEGVPEKQYNGRPVAAHHLLAFRVLGKGRPFTFKVKVPPGHALSQLALGQTYDVQGQLSLNAANGAPGAFYVTPDLETVQVKAAK